MGSLTGKNAIVTGAGQGVGRGIALALAAQGAAVVLAGRTVAKLEAVAAEIAARGGTAVPVACDVKVLADIERCVAEAKATLGSVDILVNNAHEPPLGSILDVDDDAFRAGFDSGPLATLRFMRVCYPHLRGGGVIINLGSGTSVNPNPIGRGAYGAIKAAIQTLSRNAAVEWGIEGIRVLAIMPAASSPAADAFAENSPEAFALSLQSIPLRRLGDAEKDIGRVVAFLCGPDAGYLTGTTLAIDGGQAYLR